MEHFVIGLFYQIVTLVVLQVCFNWRQYFYSYFIIIFYYPLNPYNPNCSTLLPIFLPFIAIVVAPFHSWSHQVVLLAVGEDSSHVRVVWKHQIRGFRFFPHFDAAVILG